MGLCLEDVGPTLEIPNDPSIFSFRYPLKMKLQYKLMPETSKLQRICPGGPCIYLSEEVVRIERCSPRNVTLFIFGDSSEELHYGTNCSGRSPVGSHYLEQIVKRHRKDTHFSRQREVWQIHFDPSMSFDKAQIEMGVCLEGLEPTWRYRTILRSSVSKNP